MNHYEKKFDSVKGLIFAPMIHVRHKIPFGLFSYTVFSTTKKADCKFELRKISSISIHDLAGLSCDL